jgi:hypothetical protein
MKEFLLPLLLVIPFFVMAVIAWSIWHAYRVHRLIRGTAPFVPSPRFSTFMCTLLLPDTFRAKAALLAGQPDTVRAEIGRRVGPMRIGIGLAAALVVAVAIAMIATSARA